MSKGQFHMGNSNVIPMGLISMQIIKHLAIFEMLCLDMFKCQFHMGNSNVIPIGVHLHVHYQNLVIHQGTN